MAKKIKRSPTSKPLEDPELEEVDEERSFGLEYDEETNDVVMVCHYRRQWGDSVDADIEHLWNMEETLDTINILTEFSKLQQQFMINKAIREGLVITEKSTPKPIEGNPMQGGKDGA